MYVNQTTGKIVYDPNRGDMKSHTAWWCVAEVNRELTRYYRWWVQRETGIVLNQPSWDAHVSIIRGEKDCAKLPELWKKHNNKNVIIQYEHGNVRYAKDKDQPGYFFWINVTCPEFDQIRQELGLRSGWKYHITIGRTNY